MRRAADGLVARARVAVGPQPGRHRRTGRPRRLQLRPWLAEHFSRATWLWSQFDLERIERERPDIVLEILVDRVLVQNAPRIGDLDPDWPRQAFESSSRVLLVFQIGNSGSRPEPARRDSR